MPTETDATLPDTQPSPPRASVAVIDERYDLREVIGRGGMGEVRLAKDSRIHRDVAVKLMRAAAKDEETLARFFREAHVQGRLDHPAIVPVHDLGIDSDGQPYFVMKRLAGTTLADVLAQKHDTRRLLEKLHDVCLAIQFAHERGVVHRDLKPANIMLGDYGEAYVLDWGLARVADDSELASLTSLSGEDGHTQAGALLGTPGYMSPEQARGELVDAATDVYALGCVLFEILAGSPAHPRGLAAIESTLAADELRPSTRAEAPPELDDLCARATAADRTQRPTARGLADGIQKYLDGDRDVARRKAMANDHVERARAAYAKGNDDGRAIAMREAARAFTLDDTNDAAKDLIASLTLTAPEHIPAAAIEDANRERAQTRKAIFKGAAAIYLTIAAALTLLFAFPIKHVWPIVFSMSMCVAMSAVCYYTAQRSQPKMSAFYLLVLTINTAVLISSAYIFGPLLILPVFICGSLTVSLSTPVAFPTAPLFALHVLAFAIPIATELLGITARTFSLEGGQMTLVPYAVDLSPGAFALVLLVAITSHFANAGAIVLIQRRSQERATDHVHAQSWHLKQLLPGAGDERSK